MLWQGLAMALYIKGTSCVTVETIHLPVAVSTEQLLAFLVNVAFWRDLIGEFDTVFYYNFFYPRGLARSAIDDAQLLWKILSKTPHVLSTH